MNYLRKNGVICAYCKVKVFSARCLTCHNRVIKQTTQLDDDSLLPEPIITDMFDIDFKFSVHSFYDSGSSTSLPSQGSQAEEALIDEHERQETERARFESSLNPDLHNLPDTFDEGEYDEDDKDEADDFTALMEDPEAEMTLNEFILNHNPATKFVYADEDTFSGLEIESMNVARLQRLRALKKRYKPKKKRKNTHGQNVQFAECPLLRVIFVLSVILRLYLRKSMPLSLLIGIVHVVI
eukprot:TRINITY_DN14_c0_g1_i3.p1 TRINITY_DN14_c0_g1~~TRINITY_DN14_c0_g1_i3.p1  ORF type:complete len:239 (-),score=39.14 TRINITY_DN14_c0_g1_i3:1347-2063(-)